MLYCNDGDWVESLTALVEHHDGRLEIIDRGDRVWRPALKPAAAQPVAVQPQAAEPRLPSPVVASEIQS